MKSSLAAIAFSAALVSISISTANAGPWVNTKATQLQAISTASCGRIYVIFETPIGSDNCQDTGPYYAIKVDTAQGKNMRAVALAARTAGAPVSAFTHGCDDTGRNVLGGLWMY